MDRPTLEVADVLRAGVDKFLNAGHPWITWMHIQVLRAILRCRTPALGGHVEPCSQCGHRAISYNSCRNRHCPKCQAHARDRWLPARQRDLLPVAYAHLVFTLPHQLGPLALRNKSQLYDLLFRASAETLLEVARDPRLLGAEIGFFSVLHTWNQKLLFHPHVPCGAPAGGLSADHTRWISSRRRSFLPKHGLREVLRGKFVEGLQAWYDRHELTFTGAVQSLSHPKVFAALLSSLFEKDWGVYCQRPFRGAEHALRYLGSYTHRVAISHHRLVELRDDQVTFRWRDSAHDHQHRLMTLPADEFIRRFLLHVLPAGFVRIRHFGFLAHRRRSTLVPLCFRLLCASVPATVGCDRPLWSCPRCGGAMGVVERLSPAQARLRSPPRTPTAPLCNVL